MTRRSRATNTHQPTYQKPTTNNQQTHFQTTQQPTTYHEHNQRRAEGNRQHGITQTTSRGMWGRMRLPLLRGVGQSTLGNLRHRAGRRRSAGGASHDQDRCRLGPSAVNSFATPVAAPARFPRHPSGESMAAPEATPVVPAESAPVVSPTVVAKPAEASAETMIGAFAELNTVAAKSDAVFVYLLGKEETSGMPPPRRRCRQPCERLKPREPNVPSSP